MDYGSRDYGNRRYSNPWSAPVNDSTLRSVAGGGIDDGQYSSPSRNYDRSYSDLSWKGSVMPMVRMGSSRSSYEEHSSFGKPTSGVYGDQFYGVSHHPAGSSGSSSFGSGPSNGYFGNSSFVSEPPYGSYGGKSYGDSSSYGGQAVNWEEEMGPTTLRHGPFADDTWRIKPNVTWRDNHSNQYEEPRSNEVSCYHRRNRSPLNHSERTFPRKNDLYYREHGIRHDNIPEERSRYYATKGSGEHGRPCRPSSRVAVQSSSKEATKNETAKSELKKDEAKSNVEVNERRPSEQKEQEDKNAVKEDKDDNKQSETMKMEDDSNEIQASKTNDDSSRKNDDSGKDLRIRTDLTHDDIHHFKPHNVKNRKEHQKSAVIVDQKESFRKYLDEAVKMIPMKSSGETMECMIPVADDSPPLRISSPVLDPEKYIEELSNPDIDPQQLDEIANELLPKKNLRFRGDCSSHRKPLISDHPFPNRNIEPDSNSDDFGSFFSGPIIGGPSKMHVKRRTLVSSPPPPPPERPYKPGLLDGPPNKRSYEESYYMRPPSPHRPMKPGLLDGPPMKAVERLKNGPVAHPTISAVTESITTLARTLAPPNIIAAVTEKEIANELLSNENLKAKLKEVYTEEIQKILAKKLFENEKSTQEPERPRSTGAYSEEGSRKILPRLADTAGSRIIDYDNASYSREQRGDAQRLVHSFHYNGPKWMMQRRDDRFAAATQKPIKMMDNAYQNDNSKYYDDPSYHIDAHEEKCYGRGSGVSIIGPTAHYEDERYRSVPNRFARYSPERCSRPSSVYHGDSSHNYKNAYPDRYNGPSGRYNGPAPERHKGPFMDRY